MLYCTVYCALLYSAVRHCTVCLINRKKSKFEKLWINPKWKPDFISILKILPHSISCAAAALSDASYQPPYLILSLTELFNVLMHCSIRQWGSCWERWSPLQQTTSPHPQPQLATSPPLLARLRRPVYGVSTSPSSSLMDASKHTHHKWSSKSR